MKYSNFRGIKKIEVYEVEVSEGMGIEGDPIYREKYYVSVETGEVIGRNSNEPLRELVGNK